MGLFPVFNSLMAFETSAKIMGTSNEAVSIWGRVGMSQLVRYSVIVCFLSPEKCVGLFWGIIIVLNLQFFVKMFGLNTKCGTNC